MGFADYNSVNADFFSVEINIAINDRPLAYLQNPAS